MNGDEELTDLQKAFCREYPFDWNGTKAAIRAGYSENGASVTGSQLLANPKIRAEIDRAIDLELGIKRSILKARVIGELEKLGYSDKLDDDGRPAVRINDKIKALELLGKYGCLFTERFELVTPAPIDTSNLTPEERDAIIRAGNVLNKPKDG
jgi:phage terminase small subunit